MAALEVELANTTIANLYKLSAESHRTPESEIEYLVNEEIKAKQARKLVSDHDPLMDIMDQIARASESNLVSSSQEDFISGLLASGITLFGENENGEFVEFATAR